MELINQSIKILEVGGKNFTPAELVKHHGQKCWQSDSTRTPEEFVTMLIKKGHESVLEQSFLSTEMITDIGIGREILRHRHGSPSQESTNFCIYDKGIRFLKPFDWDKMTPRAKDSFLKMCYTTESCYLTQLAEGRLPKYARDNLPLCMATDIGLSGNFRYWRNMFKQRVVGTTGKPHPRVQALFLDLLVDLCDRPDTRIFFADILSDYRNKSEGPSVS
jgi:thymidylate synthase (FAD)